MGQAVELHALEGAGACCACRAQWARAKASRFQPSAQDALHLPLEWFVNLLHARSLGGMTKLCSQLPEGVFITHLEYKGKHWQVGSALW